jgi:hypothetical protein
MTMAEPERGPQPDRESEHESDRRSAGAGRRAGAAEPGLGPDLGSAREEAERLVAAAFGAASVAARGLVRAANPLSGVADTAERLLAGGRPGHVATGSPECCVCPVCRGIAAVRDPDPRLALKLASSAADLASTVTEALRLVGDAVSRPPAPTTGGTAAAPRRPSTAPDPDVTWRMATATKPDPARRDDEPNPGEEPDDPWHAATTAG